MRFVRTAVALCGIFAASAALAQTGGIKVVVTDQAKLPLPGAIVTISNELGYVKTTSEATSVDGIVEFPILRAGQGYTIQVTFPGFTGVRLEKQHVRIGEVMTLPVEMLEEMVETVKAVATPDVVNLDDSTQTTRFSDDFIADLPVPGRFYQNVLTMAPGVQDADGDGNPNVHGSRERDFQTQVGGVSNVDPLTGQWLSRVNTNSIEEMNVITAGAGVEFGRAQGGFSQIIQKQGSNQHEGVVETYWRTSKLDGDGARDDSDLPTQDFDSYQPGFQFTGPIVRDKLWYRASYELIDDEVPVNVLSGIETQTRKRETRDAQVTWQVSPRNKLAFVYAADPEERDNDGISSAVRPESSRHYEQDVTSWRVNWTAPFSPKVLIDTTVAWQDVNQTTSPQTEGTRNDCVPNANQEFLHTAYCTDLSRQVVSGSFNGTQDDHRQRFTMKSQAKLYGGRFWGMSHQFTVGMSVENERYFRRLEIRPEMTFQIISLMDDNSGAPPGQGGEGDLETFGLVNATFYVPESDSVRTTGTSWALYGEDEFKPAQNVTLTLGGRLDREELSSEGREQFYPTAELDAYTAFLNDPNNGGYEQASQHFAEFFTGYEGIPAFEDQVADIVCHGSVDPSCATNAKATVDDSPENTLRPRNPESFIVQNFNLSPYLAFAWSPGSDGKTAIKASARRYYNNIPLFVQLQEIQPARSQVSYRASLDDPDSCPPPDPDDDPIVACGQVQLQGNIDPRFSIVTVDRGLRTPYQDELTLTFERELWAETQLRVTYLDRQYHDQPQDENINLKTGDLGACRKVTNTQKTSIVESDFGSGLADLNTQGRSFGVCSVSHARCDPDNPVECSSGEICGYDYYMENPSDFCAISGSCIGSPGFDWEGTCQIGNPFCGVPYPDRAAGPGDGFLDPFTGSTLDNCSGDFDTLDNSGSENACGPDDPFCSKVTVFEKPDRRTDLYLQNPFWGDIFRVGNINEIDYHGYVLELIRRQYRGWEMNGSYTYSETKGDGEDWFDELGDDPTLRENEFGYQKTDQRHVVKINATSVTPWGIRLGGQLNWQSGLPYSLLVQQFSNDTAPPLTQDISAPDPRNRQIYPTGVRNDQRNESYWNVNLKATKELRLGKDMNLQVSAEVFNLLDDDTLIVDNTINDDLDAVRRFGRQWQLGMKLSF